MVAKIKRFIKGLLRKCKYLFIQLQDFTWALTQENVTLLHVNNKGEDQPAHLCSLISAFVNCSLESKRTSDTFIGYLPIF